MKRAPKVKSKSVNMMGASIEPWMKKAKKPEADAKPKNPGPPSVNKNVAKGAKAAREKRLTGKML